MADEVTELIQAVDAEVAALRRTIDECEVEIRAAYDRLRHGITPPSVSPVSDAAAPDVPGETGAAPNTESEPTAPASDPPPADPPADATEPQPVAEPVSESSTPSTEGSTGAAEVPAPASADAAPVA